MVARRRSSKKAGRKASRKSRKASRKTRRSQKQQQYRQRGGMAAYSTGNAYLLDGPTRIQAEVGPLDRYIAELPSLIPRQTGGRRRGGKRSGSKRRSQRRSQRGGAAPFGDPYMIFQNPQGVNPQFSTEHYVRPHTYVENGGAQTI